MPFDARAVAEIVAEAFFRLRHGPRYLVTAVRDLLFDADNDRRFGICSSTSRGRLGAERHGDCLEYMPSSYLDFPHLMELLPVPAESAVFVDYGSGMGRVLCLAAIYPFRTVIGVELSAALSAVALENLDRVRDRLACDDVRVVTANAVDYEIAPDANVLFFFNPFAGSIFEGVLTNLARSLKEHPRDVTVIWSGPGTHQSCPHLLDTCGWLVKRASVILPTGRIGSVYANTCWTSHAVVHSEGSLDPAGIAISAVV